MPEQKRPGGVYLLLHPDGHWIPDTVGRWRWKPREHAGDERVGWLEFEVFEKHGSLMYRPLTNLMDVGSTPYDSIRMAEPGTWEWVTPVEDSEITP